MSPKKHNHRNCPEYLRLGIECNYCDDVVRFVKPEISEAYERTLNDLGNTLSNKVYEAAVGICERAESAGLIIGNGHHMAQKLASAAKKELLERFEKVFGASR